MQYASLKKLISKPCLIMMVCITALSGSAKAGLDYYEIFVGKNLIYKRYLNEDLNLKNLPLTQANASEQLVIHYYQCNAPNKLGSKRSITLKDENGNTIKQWKFADAGKSKTGMAIPVKELLQIQKTSKSKTLTFFYAAEGRQEGQKIASIAGATKSVSYMFKKQTEPANNIVLSRQLPTRRQYI